MGNPYQTAETGTMPRPVTVWLRSLALAPFFLLLSLGYCTPDYGHWGGDFGGLRSTYFMGVPHFISYQDVAWTTNPGSPQPGHHTGFQVQWGNGLVAIIIVSLVSVVGGLISRKLNPNASPSLTALATVMVVVAPPALLGFLPVISPAAEDLIRSYPYPLRLVVLLVVPIFVFIAAYVARRYFAAFSYSLLAFATLWWSDVMSRVVQAEHLSQPSLRILAILLPMVIGTWLTGCAGVFLARRFARSDVT